MEKTRFTDCIKRTTRGASLRGISGLDVSDSNPFLNSFVFNECLKLVESPSTENSIESLSSTFAPDSIEVFHYYSSCINTFDNSSTDDVVRILHKPCLSASKHPKMPLGGFCAFTLKSIAEINELSQSGFHATEELLVACDGKFVYSDINSDKVRAKSGLNVFGNKDVNEEVIAFFNEVCATCVPTKIFREANRDYDRYFDSSIYGGYADDVVLKPKVLDIITNWNDADFFGISILGDETNCLTGKLGRQNSFLSDKNIALFMKCFKSPHITMTGSNKNSFLELKESLRNRIVLRQLNPDNYFGSHSHYLNKKIYKAEIPP